MNGVSKETFQTYDTNAKLDTLYEYAHATWEKVEKVERWKPLNAMANLIGGAIGGIIAVCAWIKIFR